MHWETIRHVERDKGSLGDPGGRGSGYFLPFSSLCGTGAYDESESQIVRNRPAFSG